jgi:hypothetical protein
MTPTAGTLVPTTYGRPSGEGGRARATDALLDVRNAAVGWSVTGLAAGEVGRWLVSER